MHARWDIAISVRSQAVVVLALAAFWWVSFLETLGEVGTKCWIWSVVCLFLPFAIATFAVILLASFCRSARVYRRWVFVAVLAAVSCWVVFLGYMALAWYL
jgi:hypothetical protein